MNWYFSLFNWHTLPSLVMKWFVTPLFNSRRQSAYIAFQFSRVLREVRTQVSITGRAFHCILVCLNTSLELSISRSFASKKIRSLGVPIQVLPLSQPHGFTIKKVLFGCQRSRNDTIIIFEKHTSNTWYIFQKRQQILLGEYRKGTCVLPLELSV